MPLRKSKTAVTIACAALFAGAAVPSTASAWSWGSWYTKATPTPTPTPTTSTTASTTTSGAKCQELPTTKAFQRVDGDTADYSVAPGGDFEGSASSWTLENGARLIPGNEMLGVKSGRQALQIPLSGSATSPEFCVDETKPHFRFAYKVDNAVLSGFIAYVLYRDANGKITNVELVSSKALTLSPSTWQATPNSPLATLLPLDSSKTATVQLKIVALNPVDFVDDTATAIIGENVFTSMVHVIGSWGTNLAATTSGAVGGIANVGITVDSVMVDPYRRG